MQTLLLTAILLIAIMLIVCILLQRSEGGALGIGGGGGGGAGFGGLFSPRGASNALTSATSWLAVAFFVFCLALNILVARQHKQQSILDSQPAPTQPATPAQRSAAPPAQQPAPTVPTPR